MNTSTFKDKFIKTNFGKIHLLDNGIRSKNLILIFPPGFQDARFVKTLRLNSAIKSSRLIAISYPSRYKSERINSYDYLGRLVEACFEILEKLDLNKYSSIRFVGFSFGTMIITRLFQEKLTNLKTKNIKIILITPGEYFSKLKRKFLINMFKPAIHNLGYAKFLKKILTYKSEIFDKNQFHDDRLSDICEQWISTLRYKINLTKKINYKTTTFSASKDSIIDPKSNDKLKSVYQNLEIKCFKGDHIFNYKNSKQYKGIKKELINEIIN